MTSALAPSLFVTLPGNGSFSPADAATISWLSANDPYYHDSPVAMYAYAVLSLLSLVAIAPALAWHISAGNLPASCIVGWTFFLNANGMASALIWPTDDVSGWWPGWGYCDLAAKLSLAADVGLVGAALCILRSLAAALDTAHLASSLDTSPRRRRAFEWALCAGAPLAHALSHLLVQDARYMIYAVAGCAPTWQSSVLGAALMGAPPALLALAATCHAALVLVRVTRYRRDFKVVLAASSAGMGAGRFFRLYALAGLLVLVYLPFKLHDLAIDATARAPAPFDWAAAHAPAAWAAARMYPTFGAVLPFVWTYPALAAAVVATVGLGADAHGFYGDALLALGFGGIFPSLRQAAAARRSCADAASSQATLVGRASSEGSRGSRSQASADSLAWAKRKWWAALAEPAAAHLGFRVSRGEVDAPAAYAEVRVVARAEDRAWRAMEEGLGLR